MFDWLTSPEHLIALVTLVALEIVLGVDNIVVLTVIVEKLPEEMRQRARMIGLGLAMGLRVVLLFSISWIMGLTADLFTIPTFGLDFGGGGGMGHGHGHGGGGGEAVAAVAKEVKDGIGISGRDLILILGGLFLLAKGTKEIDQHLKDIPESVGAKAATTFGAALVQITLLDIVFSLDSVITAVGMAERIEVMVVAVVIAVLCMMLFAKRIGEFVAAHPTVQMLALSFLILIGVTLVADGLDFHIPKGYIYFAMAFSLGVQMLNLKAGKKHAPAS